MGPVSSLIIRLKSDESWMLRQERTNRGGAKLPTSISLSEFTFMLGF